MTIVISIQQTKARTSSLGISVISGWINSNHDKIYKDKLSAKIIPNCVKALDAGPAYPRSRQAARHVFDFPLLVVLISCHGPVSFLVGMVGMVGMAGTLLNIGYKSCNGEDGLEWRKWVRLVSRSGSWY